MERPDVRDRRIRELEERLSRLSRASLRITEDLDFNTVLQAALDSARSLGGARYGAITLVDASLGLREVLSAVLRLSNTALRRDGMPRNL